MSDIYTSTYTDEKIDESFKKFYNSLNTVNVITTPGSSVIMTIVIDNETIQLSSIEHEGVWRFYPTYFGTWTITSHLGQSTQSQTIDINSIALRTINL